MAQFVPLLLLVALVFGADVCLAQPTRTKSAQHRVSTRCQSPDGPLFAPPMAQTQRVAGDPSPATVADRSSDRSPNSGLPANGGPGVDNPQSESGALSAPPAQIFESAQILARVGSETILASDVVPLAEEALAQKLQEVPKEQRAAITAEQYQKLKWQFTKVLLEQIIDVKIRYADAVANIPKENLPHIKSNINDSFDRTILKKFMAKYGASTRSELEEKMAAAGQSLDRQKQMFFERSLAGGWENQHVKENREIPVSEQLGHYQQHITDYEYPSKARWEELMVAFDRFNSREEAYRALVEMGNDVLRGADFAEVAKARSSGPTRLQGGVYEWTTKGSLVSKRLDEAIFGLPIGRMSQILEDDAGFHIVRVIERVEAGCKPFLEAQTEIRKQLREANLERQRKEFLAKIKQRTPVWSIFDVAAGNAAADATLGGRPTSPPR